MQITLDELLQQRALKRYICYYTFPKIKKGDVTIAIRSSRMDYAAIVLKYHLKGGKIGSFEEDMKIIQWLRTSRRHLAI